MMSKTFVDAFIAGEVGVHAIHDYIEYWHTHDTGNRIYEFLGMTDKQYYDWAMAESDESLFNILNVEH